MSYDMIGGAADKMLAGGLASGLGRLGPARSSESQREALLLDIEQAKINLRHAELRLKQHDEWEAERKEMESQVVRAGAFGSAVRNENFAAATRGAQMGQAE